MNLNTLQEIASFMVENGKGILAADESNPSIGKHLEKIGQQNTEDNRRAWRDLLINTPGLQQYIGGVIMFEETLNQSTADGCPFVDVLEGLGVVPGIKVDKGLEAFDGDSDQNITTGLDGLEERLQGFAEKGAKFAKWRALIKIGENIPTIPCIEENASRLAKYAKACQNAGIVPIVEPEIFLEGKHTYVQAKDVTTATIKATFQALIDEKVELDGMLLKPSMVLAGSESGDEQPEETVARVTLDMLKETVPAEVPGIVFLSGGQSEITATKHLDLMNRLAKQEGGTPWKLSYSYGRGLQESALRTWAGKPENRRLAQNVFFHRAQCNSAAALGEYTQRLENRNPLA